jgi:hypothetical protein
MAALPRKWVSDGAPTLESTDARFVTNLFEGIRLRASRLRRDIGFIVLA